jgi:hypothetical protein
LVFIGKGIYGLLFHYDKIEKEIENQYIKPKIQRGRLFPAGNSKSSFTRKCLSLSS